MSKKLSIPSIEIDLFSLEIRVRKTGLRHFCDSQYTGLAVHIPPTRRKYAAFMDKMEIRNAIFRFLSSHDFIVLLIFI